MSHQIYDVTIRLNVPEEMSADDVARLVHEAVCNEVDESEDDTARRIHVGNVSIDGKVLA
jgi:tRNA threonylcarbamoyladenosine modification (KEOPS) complex  Pcc1 subunit